MSVSVTATSRLKKDMQRLMKEPIPYVRAAPLPENILEWHYIIFGAPSTPYDGGVYHGKLIFPPDFPFKPPSILMITPLCLSISDFHPDTWNPAWTVGTILCGLLSFMNENQQTLGSVTSTDAEKRVYAKRSKAFNLKNPTFCKLFEDVAKQIREEQRNQTSEDDEAAASRAAEESSAGGAVGGAGSGLVANLVVIVGIVIIAFAIRHVILAAQEQDANFKIGKK